MEEMERVVEDPEITRIIDLIVKNSVLSDILGEQHTTQGFNTAAELAAAFQGKLAGIDPAILDEAVSFAMDEYTGMIRENGIDREDLVALFNRVWIYSRLTNPTNELLEESLATLENMEKASVFGSGLAAIRAAVEQFVPPARKGEHGEYIDGGKIVVIGSIYGGTYAMLMRACKKMGFQFEHLTISEFRENGLPDDAKLVLFESSNNPVLQPIPIPDVVEEAKKVGAITLCDNTFTPLIVRPSDFDVDLVVHSMTKYLNGKSEDLGGVVCGSQELINQFMDVHEGERMTGGGVMAPRVAKEFLNNMRDLPERLFLASKNARALRDAVEEFGYDAKTVESYKTYKKIRSSMPAELMNGMVSVFFDSQEEAQEFVDMMIAEGMGLGAVSLGAKRTYYSIPSETTHSEMPLEEQAKIGITPGLVRISCGIEKDLVEKVCGVLERMKG